MFNRLINKDSDYKNKDEQGLNLGKFKFFSKVNSAEENIFNLAKSLESSSSNTIKDANSNKINDIIEKASLADLIKYMKSDNETIRSLAAQAFANCGSPNIVNCIDLMLRDKSEDLRASCIEALMYLDAPEKIRLLSKGMKDSSASVRLKAAICTAELASIDGDNEAIELLNSAVNDSDAEVREFVIDELGLIGNSNSLNTLISSLETSKAGEKNLLNESIELLMTKALA